MPDCRVGFFRGFDFTISNPDHPRTPPARRPVAAARRKSLLIDCARLASERLARLEDPDFVDFADHAVIGASAAWPRLASAMRMRA